MVAIVTTRVTDDILRYRLDQKDKKDVNGSLVYQNGPMKAAYGTFLESLLVIKCHDIVADAAANKYNVTWSRTTPIVVSVCDDAYETYITGEMDHRMGMDVVGDVENVKAFRYACSSSFSAIEYWVGSALFPSDNPASNLLGSVTLGLGYKMFNGEPLEIFESNGYTIIRAVGDNQRILIIDPATGLVRDAGSIDLNDTISGTRCYGDQQTEWGNSYGNSILDNEEAMKRAAETGEAVATDFGQDDMQDEVLGMAGSIAISIGIALLIATGPPGWLALGVIGLGMAGCFFAADLDENPLSTSNWIKFGLMVGPSLIPVYGAEASIGSKIGWNTIKSVSYTRGSFIGSAKSGSTLIGAFETKAGTLVTASYQGLKEGFDEVVTLTCGDSVKDCLVTALASTPLSLTDRTSVVIDEYSEEIDDWVSVRYNSITDYILNGPSDLFEKYHKI